MNKPKNILIDLDTIRVGDTLTLRKEHEQEGLVNGDLLIVTKITKSSNCPVYVYSLDYKGGLGALKDKSRGYGFFVWSYEYLDMGEACIKCTYSCKQNKDECSLLEERAV